MTFELTSGHIVAETQDGVGRLTLNRPQALNALSLAMIRDIAQVLLAWQSDASIHMVMMRGMSRKKNKETGESSIEPFGAFCAGGDIRYFYEAVHSQPTDVLNRASLEDFFTEEYSLNYLIHNFGKPVVAFMDGVVMGGGMGLTQGASIRVVTERTKMAMPETAIGLFPDVGGGYFLSRCADAMVGVGEYLALSNVTLTGEQAVGIGLGDVCVTSNSLQALWDCTSADGVEKLLRDARAKALSLVACRAHLPLDLMQRHFAAGTVVEIEQSLAQDDGEWAQKTLALVRKFSPLMQAVSLLQVQKARNMTLAEDLAMERTMVYHCFAGTPLTRSDTVEGIRALVIDKDQKPQWLHADARSVSQAEVDAFFNPGSICTSPPVTSIHLGD